MEPGPPGSFGAQLKALREAAGYTQEELADVQRLRTWLVDLAAPLTTLIGPGGVGKTRLALELARAIAGEGSTRVVLASLTASRHPGLPVERNHEKHFR